MRGKFHDEGGLFSYISPEKRVPANHPLRKIRELVREVLKELTQPGKALCQRWASLGTARAVVERAVAAGFLWHPVGAAVDGTTGLQSPVPLVCRPCA